MRVIIRSSYSQNNRNIFELTTKNHAEYCERHGYTYLPVDEPYSPYINVDMVFDLLDEYDMVVTIGCDVVIQQPDTPIDKFFHRGVTLCREVVGPTLNGDLILWGGVRCGDILNRLRHFQPQRGSTQSALNAMYGKVKGIFEEPYMQIADPAMNPKVDYTGKDVAEYFSRHYHTLGEVANPPKKYEKLREALI